MTYTFNHLTTGTLARLADTHDPDTHDGIGFTHDVGRPDPVSPGAEFLRLVADSVAEVLNDPDRCTDSTADLDDLREAAEGAVSVYTYTLWTTFTDLCAWTEIDELRGSLGAETLLDTSDSLPTWALSEIAGRLAVALAHEADVEV